VLPDLTGQCANDLACPKASYCSTSGFCKPRQGGGGPCTGEGDHACLSGFCTGATCAHCPRDMSYVGTAVYPLGSDNGDVLADADELPQHPVTLSAYCVDSKETTVASYRACFNAGTCSAPADAAAFGDANCNWTANAGAAEGLPVNCLTWFQAGTYCSWPGNGTVHAAGARRLLTEAEWEAQARGADKRLYSWGSAPMPDCTHANFDPTAMGGMGSCIGMAPKTLPPGSLPAGNSPFGDSDTAGNVYEWVNDWYGDTYYSTCMNGCTNPQGPGSSAVGRVIRGGAFTSQSSQLRCAYRNYTADTTQRSNLGVRCASAPF
jgi:formylglycine-generating enzyme required for sulfatase activity